MSLGTETPGYVEGLRTKDWSGMQLRYHEHTSDSENRLQSEPVAFMSLDLAKIVDATVHGRWLRSQQGCSDD
jgi:hypothetical protein